MKLLFPSKDILPYLIPEHLPLDQAFNLIDAHYRGNRIPATVLKRNDFENIEAVESSIANRIQEIMMLDEAPELIQRWPMKFLWRGIRNVGKSVVIFYLVGDRVAEYMES